MSSFPLITVGYIAVTTSHRTFPSRTHTQSTRWSCWIQTKYNKGQGYVLFQFGQKAQEYRLQDTK